MWWRGEVFEEVLTLRTRALFYWVKVSLLSQISEFVTSISRISEPIPGMLNPFFIVVTNMVMKFQNVDIFNKFCSIFDLSSALACRVESILRMACFVDIFLEYSGLSAWCYSVGWLFAEWSCCVYCFDDVAIFSRKIRDGSRGRCSAGLSWLLMMSCLVRKAIALTKGWLWRVKFRMESKQNPFKASLQRESPMCCRKTQLCTQGRVSNNCRLTIIPGQHNCSAFIYFFSVGHWPIEYTFTSLGINLWVVLWGSPGRGKLTLCKLYHTPASDFVSNRSRPTVITLYEILYSSDHDRLPLW